MTATTTHGLPYPEASDPVADGAAAIQGLAEALDPTHTLTVTTLGTSFTSSSTSPVAFHTSIDQTLTSTGTSDEWEVTLSADLEHAAGAYSQLNLHVDAPAVTPVIATLTGAQQRMTVTRVWKVTGLAAGTHTVQFSGHLATGAGTFTVYATHTQCLVRRVR
jgi:hypothetical protein